MGRSRGRRQPGKGPGPAERLSEQQSVSVPPPAASVQEVESYLHQVLNIGGGRPSHDQAPPVRQQAQEQKQPQLPQQAAWLQQPSASIDLAELWRTGDLPPYIPSIPASNPLSVPQLYQPQPDRYHLQPQQHLHQQQLSQIAGEPLPQSAPWNVFAPLGLTALYQPPGQPAPSLAAAGGWGELEPQLLLQQMRYMPPQPPQQAMHQPQSSLPPWMSPPQPLAQTPGPPQLLHGPRPPYSRSFPAQLAPGQPQPVHFAPYGSGEQWSSQPPLQQPSLQQPSTHNVMRSASGMSRPPRVHSMPAGSQIMAERMVAGPSRAVHPQESAFGHHLQRDGRFSLERVTIDAHALLEAISPSPDEAVRRQQLLEFLNQVVQLHWPGNHCEIYGSSASSFALRGADVDATIFCDDRQAEEMEFSDDEQYDFEYSRAQRTKPQSGRHAEKQWRERQEKRKAQFDERREGDQKSCDDSVEEGRSRQDSTRSRNDSERDRSDSAVEPVAGAATTTEPNQASEEAEGDSALANKSEKPANLGAQNVIIRLGRDLVNAGATQVLPLPRARVPVVKFHHIASGVSCDVCVNNRLATENTRLLLAYSSIDPRVTQLTLLVKYWAKSRGINSPYRGTLSSYAYVLLVIFFLQTREPPVLPVLQQIRERGADTHGSDNGSQDLMINEHNCYFARHLTRIEAQGGFGAYARNRESLGSLLYHFFRFFARDFNYKDHVISIRLGAVLTKEKKDWTPRRNSRHDRYWWCIEDPFELTHNLGRVADRDSLFTMRGEFMRAEKTLEDGGSLEQLCEKFQPDTPSEPVQAARTAKLP